MTMLKPKDIAKRLGVTVRTFQRWDNESILKGGELDDQNSSS